MYLAKIVDIVKFSIFDLNVICTHGKLHLKTFMGKNPT